MYYISAAVKVTLLTTLCSLTFVGVCQGSSAITRKEPTRCGDWVAYGDEKCFKIVATAGHQTQKDAEIVCESFSENLHYESYPRLITIKTKAEQEFLEHFLFVENQLYDNVWLGLTEVENSTTFEWNDGADVLFSNWVNQTVTDDDHQCVEMESGRGFHSAGLWLKVDCRKRNVVVCERTQTWTLETLQNMFLNYKMEQELLRKEWEKEIHSLKQSNEASRQEISNLKQTSKKEMEKLKTSLKKNPVPIGFIYIQLPHQDPPTSLWPTTKWQDVSTNYSGLFFRVSGGNASEFGEIQEENSPHLAEVKRKWTTKFDTTLSREVPPDGNWSENIYTGLRTGNDFNYLQFRLSEGEVRPRNQAMKIWQRIK